ncbi:MAG: hypothetical protein M1812_002517 [Candelaria pacifica]|nr:MAG: hypothetical protein M1812_002517 [Candelaria pacifica]
MTDSKHEARPERTIYVGPFVHSKSLQEIDICESGVIGVNEEGKIAFIDRNASFDKSRLGWEEPKILRIQNGGFYFPGFIDTHIHASQYPNCGIFGHSTLLSWLQTYTFPLESSLSDLSKARKVYSRCIARTLSHGTTTAAYYATTHVPATNLLADLCLAAGQRAFIGRVCMDTDLQPDYYRDESPESAIADTRATIDHIKQIDPKHDLITPIITPRFAPSCTKPLLAALGDLHKETNLPIQTHISENKSEVALVEETFPECASYAAVYDKYNLLTPKTVLAHAVHLSPEERKLIRDRGSKVAHCPASNSALTSGFARVRVLLDSGINVGLGTDVSGGWSASVLEAARQAALVSRHVALTEGDEAKLSVEECLYLATRGGAKVLGLEQKVGGFEVGMEWDAQMIGLQGGLGDVDSTGEGPVDVFGWESWEEKIAKWVWGGDDRNTLAVWVKGRLVKQRAGVELEKC